MTELRTSYDAKESEYHCPFFKGPCHGDDCMMWRWADPAGGLSPSGMRALKRAGLDPAIDVVEAADDDRDRRGYCGLAGRPGGLL